MRLPVSIFLLAAMFLTSCANEGVIVRKDSRPFPFYGSLGVEGMYTFLLRDTAGTVRRQMVTPDVFARYDIGEYFNDLQPGTTRNDTYSDAKTVRTAMRPVTKSTVRTASRAKSIRSRQLASKSTKTKKSRKMIAKRSRPSRQKAKALHAKKTAPKPIPAAIATTAIIKAPYILPRLPDAPTGPMVFIPISRVR